MNIMLDLETLSSEPDAAIVSIGLCTFSAFGPGDFRPSTYYTAVRPKSAQAFGGRIDASTVAWWMRQSESAREIFAAEGKSITDALLEVTAFVRGFARPKIWGNGASFDNVVLRQAYKRLSIEAPWEWRDDRCYRTLKNMRPDVPFEPFGTAHNALDDAIAQARHAERIFAAMGGASA